eukprot:TRINITY_DN8899_c0_g2_i1.p1 TRINITY_DN8899_c0_g2~~TRINITY_DN8899_c0_g2_i1.p1  ORF type:complete len:435 (+),score=72.46 TRINITY_DN8899_c0_g2_i1:201-1505(+)
MELHRHDLWRDVYTWLDIWANFTYAPTPSFEGFIISDKYSSDLPAEVAISLFDVENPYSLLNSKPGSTDLWYKATKLPFGSYYQVMATETLVQEFNLTEEQFEIIAAWINSPDFTLLLESYILTQYERHNLESVQDLSYLQWIGGEVTYDGQSVSDLYDWEYDFPPCIIEFALSNPFGLDLPYILSLNETKFFLNDSRVGVFSATNLVDFCNVVQSTDPTGLETWNLNTTQGSEMGVYFTIDPGPTIGNFTFMTDVMPNNGGLFVSRSVKEWLFNATDPLLEYLQPNNPEVSFLRNDSSFEDAMRYAPSIYQTGFTNEHERGNIVVWEGKQSITGVYEVPIPVYGTSDDWERFPSDLRKTTPLNNFNEDYMRTFQLYYNDTVYDPHYTYYSYLIDQSAFGTNETLYQFPGFEGLANLTSGYKPQPFFQTLTSTG